MGGASSLLPEGLMLPARGGCIGFLRRPGLADKKYWPLFLFSSSLNRAALTNTSKTARYTKSVSSAPGLARTGGSARYGLIAVRASSHSSFHSARLAPLRVAKNGFRPSVN